MATHIPTNNQMTTAFNRAQSAQPQQQGASVNQQTQQTQQQPQAQAQSDLNSWGLDQTLIAEPMTAQSSSGAMAAFEMAMAAMKKTSNTEFKLVGVDNAVETNWHYGSVTLAQLDAQTKTAVFLPIMIVDSAKEELTGTSIRLNNSDRTVTVTPVPTDGMDSEYCERIAQEVATAFGVDRANVHYVPGMVLPRLFDLTNQGQCQAVLQRAAKSCRDFLIESRPNRPKLNVARLTGATVVAIRNNNLREDSRDTVNLPVRSDFDVTLASQAPNEQQQQLSQIQQAVRLNGSAQMDKRFGRLPFFIDFRMLPQNTSFSAYQDPRTLTRRYVPEIVISGVDLYQLTTNNALTLVLSQIAATVDPTVYRGLLFERQKQANTAYSKAPFNPCNLGMLNLYSGYGQQMQAQPGQTAQQFQPYDLTSLSLEPREFMDYLDAILLPQVAVSIDLPRMGTQAAYLSLLKACSEGDAASLAALKTFLQEYSDNKFATIFFGAGNEHLPLQADHIFSERNNSVYTGYFPMHIGDTARDMDIRHIDLVAVVNRFGPQAREMVTSYVQSFMVNNIDPVVRMVNKREAIEAYTNGSAEITGISERNTFTMQFLQALVACNTANQFKPMLQFNNPLANENSGIAAPGFMGNGLWAQGAGSAFAQAQGGNAGVGGFYANYTPGRF